MGKCLIIISTINSTAHKQVATQTKSDHATSVQRAPPPQGRRRGAQRKIRAGLTFANLRVLRRLFVSISPILI